MKVLRHVGRVCLCICLGAAAIPETGFGQDNDRTEPIGGPLAGPRVIDAPFSADATTTVRRTLGDGTRLEQTTTARYYRDRTGRVRVEHLRMGPAPKTMTERHIRIIVAFGEYGTRTLDPATRTARLTPGRELLAPGAGGGRHFAVPIGGVRFVVFHRAQDQGEHRIDGGVAGVNALEESLGSRRIAGVDTTGRRISITIPAAQFTNDRSVEMVDEQWESAALRLVVYARYSDSRSGDIEYSLTNIRSEEPPAELFIVPADYTLDIGPTGPDEPWLALIPAERFRLSDVRAAR